MVKHLVNLKEKGNSKEKIIKRRAYIDKCREKKNQNKPNIYIYNIKPIIKHLESLGSLLQVLLSILNCL